MSENETEKNKKSKMVTLRVPPEILEAFDKTHVEGDRNESLIDLMKQKVEVSGNKIEAMVDYEKLESRAESCRREMERIKKALNTKFAVIQDIALRNTEFKPENLPSIIKEILQYPITYQTPFGKNDVHDYIVYLERKCEHEKLLKEIGPIRNAKYGITVITEAISETPEQPTSQRKKRYINPKDLCGCGRYETLEEHNRRCLRIAEEMKQCSKEVHIDPLNMIRMIADYDYVSLDKEQKSILELYLTEHSLPFLNLDGVFVKIDAENKSILKAHFKEHQKEYVEATQKYEKRLKQIRKEPGTQNDLEKVIEETEPEEDTEADSEESKNDS